MTGRYAAEHRAALADIRAAGADVVFTFDAAGTLDDTTGRFTGGGSTSISGAAMGVKGNPLAYEALGLIEMEPLTLLVATDTYGDRIPLNARVTWAGQTRAVKSVAPLEPDGVPITSRVVVA